MDDSSLENARQEALELGEAFIKSIMENEQEEIYDSKGKSVGMSVLRNVVKLETGMPRDVILRSNTIPFWQKCLELVRTPDKRYKVAAIGTPGIGKTTATPILIRMLLKEGNTVVYLFRTDDKEGWYFEFTPTPEPNKSIVTKVYPETMKRNAIRSLRDECTYYIVDPGDTDSNCSPESAFKPKVILVPSPDSRHWGGTAFTKTRDTVRGFFMYMPLWSLEELLYARPVLCADMTEEEVKLNYRSFGGVPRHVFGTEAEREDALTIQDKALNVLSENHMTHIANGKMDAVDSFSRKAPKSSLMGYVLADDDNGKFSCEKAVILSPLIEEKLYSKHMAYLWDTMISLGKDGWKMFEAYTRTLMTNELVLQCRRCVGMDDKTKLFPCTLGGCTKIQLGLNLIDEVIACEQANILFHSVNRNYPLIDFAYKDINHHFHVFQATVGGKHDANLEQIKELQKKVGGASNLSIYYLVPSNNFAKFVTKPVNPNEEDKLITCDIWHVLIPDPRVDSTHILQPSTDTAVSSSETAKPITTRSTSAKAAAKDSSKHAAKASSKRAAKASPKHAEPSNEKAKSSKHTK